MRIGILGGGQLARMLALAAYPLGVEPVVLSLQESDPAAQVARRWIKGNPAVAADQSRLFSQVGLATFESEFLDGLVLAESASSHATAILPRPQLMHQLRDRLTQKKLLVKYGVATAPFSHVKTPAQLDQLLGSETSGLVFKSRTGGYDGYGTFILEAGSRAFPEPIQKDPSKFIAERKISFKRELAISFARNQKGEIVSLPWVESHQTNARCDWVKGPLKSKRLEAFQNELKNFVEAIKYVGVIAFEVFDTGLSLIVNEIAPRVHNSAHYSQDALSECQFTLHLKAILNEELKVPHLQSKAFAMANLLGASSSKVACPRDLSGRLHWYGKTENRLGRKMGHINCLADSAEQALVQALNDRRKFKI